MRSLAALLCALSLGLAAPSQGQLSFPSGFGPSAASFDYLGQPGAFAVMALAPHPGTTVVVLAPGLRCTLALDPAFTVIPLGRTDQNGRLTGMVFVPWGYQPLMQVVAFLPSAAPALEVSNLVQWQFNGCAGCGSSSG